MTSNTPWAESTSHCEVQYHPIAINRDIAMVSHVWNPQSSQIALGISFVVSLLPFSFRHHLLYFGFPNWCPESVDLIFNSDVFCLFPTGYVTLPTAAPCRGCLIPSEFYGTVILSSYFFIMASWPSFLHLARKKASMRPQNYHSTLPGSRHSAASFTLCVVASRPEHGRI